MALIFCRSCGKQVSSLAEKCPHCGAMVSNAMAQNGFQTSVNNTVAMTKRKKLPVWLWIGMVVVCIGGIVGIIYGVTRDKFKKAPNGILYCFKNVNLEGEQPNVGSLLVGELVFRLEKDTLFTNVGKPDRIFQVPDKNMFQGDIQEGLLMLHTGDKAIFKIPADSIGKLMQSSQMPTMYKQGKGQFFYFEISLRRIDTVSELEVYEAHRSTLMDIVAEAESQRKMMRRKPQFSRTIKSSPTQQIEVGFKDDECYSHDAQNSPLSVSSFESIINGTYWVSRDGFRKFHFDNGSVGESHQDVSGSYWIESTYSYSINESKEYNAFVIEYGSGSDKTTIIFSKDLNSARYVTYNGRMGSFIDQE